MVAAKWVEIGNAILNYWGPTATDTGYSLGWARGMRANPSYPCNPRTECPRARLRAGEMAHTQPTTIGCKGQKANFAYSYSLWVQRLQVPGQQHQTLLMADLQQFHDAFMAAGFEPILNVVGTESVLIDVLVGTVFDELDDPLGDPALRVSGGEIRITITGRLTNAS